jgi:hypothetical protein
MPLQSGNHGSTLTTAATVEETKMVKFLVQQGAYINMLLQAGRSVSRGEPKRLGGRIVVA